MSDAVGVAYVLAKVNGLTPDEAWGVIHDLAPAYTWEEWKELDERFKQVARAKWEETPARVPDRPVGEIPPEVVFDPLAP